MPRTGWLSSTCRTTRFEGLSLKAFSSSSRVASVLPSFTTITWRSG